MRKRIPANEVARFLRYEDETGLLYWRPRLDSMGRPNTRDAHQVAGTKKRGSIQVALSWKGSKRLYRAHHLVWAIKTGEWPSRGVDHDDGDGHNNRWANLRLATSSENNCNRHSVAGACPFRGVHFIKRLGKYGAQIKKDKKWQWLGIHETPEAAARAYDLAAARLHGSFAVTNHQLGLLGDPNGPASSAQ